jgi:hypothetical protein
MTTASRSPRAERQAHTRESLCLDNGLTMTRAEDRSITVDEKSPTIRLMLGVPA